MVSIIVAPNIKYKSIDLKISVASIETNLSNADKILTTYFGKYCSSKTMLWQQFSMGRSSLEVLSGKWLDQSSRHNLIIRLGLLALLFQSFSTMFSFLPFYTIHQYFSFCFQVSRQM